MDENMVYYMRDNSKLLTLQDHNEPQWWISLLNEDRQLQASTDIQLISKEGFSIKAHSSVLMAATPFLRDLILSQNHSEIIAISLPEVTVNCLERVLDLFYTGSVVATDRKELEEVLHSLKVPCQNLLFTEIAKAVTDTNNEGDVISHANEEDFVHESCDELSMPSLSEVPFEINEELFVYDETEEHQNEDQENFDITFKIENDEEMYDIEEQMYRIDHNTTETQQQDTASLRRSPRKSNKDLVTIDLIPHTLTFKQEISEQEMEGMQLRIEELENICLNNPNINLSADLSKVSLSLIYNYLLRCPICTRRYDHRQSVTKCLHKHNLSLCVICFALLPYPGPSLLNHMVEKHGAVDKPGSVQCFKCDLQYAPDSIWRHITNVHLSYSALLAESNIFNDDDRQEEEPQGSLRTSSRQAAHIARVNLQKMENTNGNNSDEEDEEKDEKVFSIPDVKRVSIPGRKLLEEGALYDLYIKLQACGFCKKVYSTYTEAYNCQRVHRWKRCFVCFVVSQDDMIDTHFQRHADDNGKVLCSISGCNDSFSKNDRSNYQRHVIRHLKTAATEAEQDFNNVELDTGGIDESVGFTLQQLQWNSKSK